jgi:hypothetical protein
MALVEACIMPSAASTLTRALQTFLRIEAHKLNWGDLKVIYD